ncbi:MAG TPA: hypothetical protein VNW97_11440 [Candidatus Saccharimonadales bacterium]|nr:hypothetical protein [Candidatus Saccharimonadales bacterium]
MKSPFGKTTPAFVLVSVMLAIGSLMAQTGKAASSPKNFGPAEVTRADFAKTIAVRDMVSMPVTAPNHEKPLHVLPRKGVTGVAAPGTIDPVLQTATNRAAPTVGGVSSFDGVGVGLGGFTPNSAPPDTNMAVGATQVVQWVNTSFAVFSKAGALLSGPLAGNTLFQALGASHPCAANNDGDPIAQYDKAANRWVLSQLEITQGSTAGFMECVAVSQTSDATGAFNVYAFNYGTVDFNDYPKMGVWNNAYLFTYNIFANGSTFSGPKLCALDRTAMLNGAAATQICFQLSTSFGGVLPSDIDGATAPPAGSPAYFLDFGANQLELFKMTNINFTAGTATLTGPTNIPVAAFTAACNGGGTCIPQLGVPQQLDSLADRLMYRLAYRNFGDHEALVVNHSITAGSSVGIRWYEIRSPASPVLFQQGTFAPDATFRWMGSMGMDHVGNIGVGYSVSSGSINPGIRFTGRNPADPLGTLASELTIQDGTGSQNGNLNRWGDYSSISVDPVDDCTLWYTTEYLKASGSFNWSTRIGNFKFSSCGTAADFSVSASPASQSVTQGAGTSYTTTVGAINGFTGTVNLSVSGLPSGATASFNPTSVANSGNSTLSVSTSSTTPAGTFTLTITGTSGTVSHSTTVTLVVQGPNPDFSISVSPTSLSVARGASGNYTVNIGAVNGFTGTVSLSVSGVPGHVTATFNPASVSGSGNSTLTVAVSRKASTGTQTMTITGASGSLSHSASASLTIQ